MAVSLLDKIEILRQRMTEEANFRGSLSADEVVALSQELDKYLVSYQISYQKSERNQGNKKLHFNYNRYGKIVKTSGVRQ